MNRFNNFELHEQSMNLSGAYSGHKLAKMYLQEKQELEELKEKYENLNQMFEDYLATHKVIQAELERLQMQESIDYTRVQYELEC